MNTNPETNAPVDVLAVMQQFAVANGSLEMGAAREAVKNLIRAAQAVNVAITCGKHEARIDRSNPLSVVTLRDALAAIGGSA